MSFSDQIPRQVRHQTPTRCREVGRNFTRNPSCAIHHLSFSAAIIESQRRYDHMVQHPSSVHKTGSLSSSTYILLQGSALALGPPQRYILASPQSFSTHTKGSPLLRSYKTLSIISTVTGHRPSVASRLWIFHNQEFHPLPQEVVEATSLCTTYYSSSESFALEVGVC